MNILAQWATNGVGKKLIEKFGFSEKDIAVGPTATTLMQKGQGLQSGYEIFFNICSNISFSFIMQVWDIIIVVVISS